MYLEKLGLNNFRSFERAEIPLCKDLTILVGENNGGKSNAIDAIRLLTTPLGGPREEIPVRDEFRRRCCRKL